MGGIASRVRAHLDLLELDPAVIRNGLEEVGHEELHARVPVREQQHEHYQVEQAQEHAGHVEELRVQ